MWTLKQSLEGQKTAAAVATCLFTACRWNRHTVLENCYAALVQTPKGFPFKLVCERL